MRRTNVPKEPELSDFFNLEWISKTLRHWLSRRLIWIVVISVVGLWLLSGFYMVGPGEQGLVLTFGRLTGVRDSGLHYRLPAPIQSNFVVDTARVRTAEVGYRTEGGNQNVVLEEAQMLTGDENMVVVQLFVQYLVQDPVAYLFHVRDAETVLNASAEIALRSAVGQNTIDFTMTEGRGAGQNQIKTPPQE